MAPSSLITSIDSILMSDGQLDGFLWFCESKTRSEVKIRLRNLKMLLILRRSELQLELNNFFPFRILGIIARLLLPTDLHLDHDMVSEFQSLREEVDCELSNAMNMDHSSLLTADEILGICRCNLDSSADLLKLMNSETYKVPTDAFDVRDAFEVHVRFLINFLNIGTQAFDKVEVQNFLVHIQPIVIDAACMFIKDDDDCRWYKHVESKRSLLNPVVADPQVQVYQVCFQARNVDDVVLKNFLNSLISLLWDMLRRLDLDSGRKHQFKVLYERLRLCRAFLKNGTDEKIMEQIGALICNAGVLICSPLQANISDLLRRFDTFQAQVEPETKPSKANEELSFGDLTNISTSNDADEKGVETHSTPRTVGFQEDEVALVLDRLIRGSKQLSIVPICGMAGLGKTTFALQLYNHASVLHHFRSRAQCAISHVLDKKNVLVQLLNQIQPGDYLKLSEDDLAEKLRRSLKGRRYLILLDDVWTLEVLDNLKASFPDDSTDSRIIMTSRSLHIAQQPHKLRFRSDSECLEILKVKLMHTNGWNPEIGMKIAMVCKGLPLTIVIVAGVLATTKLEGWDGILDQLSSGCVSDSESLLELSFKHLPDYLQPCFLFFGAFPEDKDVPVKKLIRLWMAEGFVESSEDVGREYMQKLIERSLVMVSEYRSAGGVKTCRIHDLLRDFCLKKAKQESFFHLLQQRYDDLSDFNEPCNLERLVIYSDATHFKESRLFCPCAQSMLFFRPEGSWLRDMSFIFQIFQLLKVLDIECIFLSNGTPSEIELLTRLRYLAIQSKISVIPPSICKLYNLETFSAFFPHREEVSFPNTFWNLRRLIYLYVRASGFTLPSEDLENSSSLMELETLSGVVFYFDDGNMEKLMRKFPRVCRLKCRIKPSEKSPEELQKIVVPEFLSHLELLTIRGYPKLKCEFGSKERLRRVTLKGLKLSREDISNIGKLPNLEVLKFYDMSFEGKRLEMEDEEFRKLRIFVMQGRLTAFDDPLERWTASDDQLPCLVRLDLRDLRGLKELPSCLWTSETLEEIQVIRCSSTVESLVRDVEEEHADFGNSIKVHIVSPLRGW